MTTWMQTRTSADYTPAVAIWPDGRQRPGNVKYIKLDSIERARRKLADGLVAWVAPGDVATVLDGLRLDSTATITSRK